jgi:GH24 family phage-related lysozyme (muramidase)
MQISNQGLIDIIGREGICLSWYYDSVGVQTIGIGETRSDGIDPRTVGAMTLEQAITRFKTNVIKQYTDALDHVIELEKLPFNQAQYDALASACYNFGSGNLNMLCRHRNVQQIGNALMLYTKPPEITARRKGEQTLYQKGIYSNPQGKVLLFPVTATHHPDYHHGKEIDIRPYFTEGPTA